MSTNISKKLQNTQMERTQKSRFSGCLLFTLCYLMANYSYIHLAPRSTEMQRSECPLAPPQWDMKLNADDTERGTYRTQSKPKLQMKAREIQKEAKRPGPPNKLVSQGGNGDSALHLGTGKNPKLTRKHSRQTQVRTPQYGRHRTSRLLFGNGY